MANHHAKFEVFCISRSAEIFRGLEIQNGSRDVTMPISGMIYRL